MDIPMAFASFDSKKTNTPMSEINMVPLIDVMLVLLIIFMLTAPLLTQSVKLDLPKANAQANNSPADKVEFSIDAAGALFWNGVPITRGAAAARFVMESQKQPQPEIHLRADQNAAYRSIAQTLADASKAGLSKVGFITEPDAQTP
jgi:biopolymer transport protein ExbD